MLSLTTLAVTLCAMLGLTAQPGGASGKPARVPAETGGIKPARTPAIKGEGLLFRTHWHDGKAYPWAVYVPRGYEQMGPLPVVLFLHGSGESGADGVRMAAVGLGPALLRNPERWPAIVIFPQKPENRTLWPAYETPVMEMLQIVLGEFQADRSRVYLTGLSQGGHGTFAFGAKHADVFAALAPVCGFGEPAEVAGAIKDLPIWAFHGLKDNVVPPEKTRAIIEAVKAAGGSPKLTEFPDANHNSWDAAYSDPELPKWLFAQRRR
jgi:predicted peptidase